jgi:hypothetical protein
VTVADEVDLVDARARDNARPRLTPMIEVKCKNDLVKVSLCRLPSPDNR